MLDKRLVIASIFIILLIGSIVYVSSMASPHQESKRKIKRRIFTFRATIVDIGEKNITLQHGNRTRTFGTYGRWVIVRDGKFKVTDWSNASKCFNVGDNVSATIAIFNRNGSRHVALIKIAKDNFYVARAPIKGILKRNVKRSRVIDVKVTVDCVKDKYFVVVKGDHKMVVVGRGEWTIAGGGTASWSDILSKLSKGDTIWIYGRIILFKRSINGTRLFFYPKTIIDLTTGFSAIRK